MFAAYGWVAAAAAPWISAAIVVAAALISTPAAAVAPEGSAVDLARQAWVPALLGPASPARFEVLDQMRANPELARQALLLAATAPETPAGRWRLIWLLGEFGRVEDIPALLARAAADSDARDQRFAYGVARALYPAYEQPADLSRVVSDFIFVQTRPAQAFEANRQGDYSPTGRVLDEYHRQGVPIDIIRSLLPLLDRGFNDRNAASQALQRALAPGEWRAWQEILLAPLEPVPPRALLEGLLRVQVFNPSERPLLLRVSYGVWRGQFDSEPPTALLYVAPNGEARLEQPARIVAPVQERGVRIDLRLRELYQAPQPLYRKLIVPVVLTQ